GYRQSPDVPVLDTRCVLYVAVLTPAIETAYENAQDSIKAHFRGRQLETAKSEIEQWKSERVYPYSEEPVSAVERAERKVFDILALNVNRHLPDFSKSDLRSKSFQFRMLRQAIEHGPEKLQRILTEV